MTRKTIYKRPEALADAHTHYCAGCGHGLANKLIAEVIDELGIRERTITIAPVGCAVLMYFYLKTDSTEAAHGRAPAVATGIKRCQPDSIVISYQGDGDLGAIGLAETIHTANRGENITVIFVNNTVYGMTGGQMAPTTLAGQHTVTSPLGRDMQTMGTPLQICELLNTLEKPYYIERVALDGVKGVRNTKKAIKTALDAQIHNKGYTFVEILSPCPTYQRCSPLKALDFVRDKMVAQYPVRVFRKEGKIVNA